MKRRTEEASATAKLKWVIELYAALLPEGQAAIDACLVVLPRRPVSELPPASEIDAALPARPSV